MTATQLTVQNAADTGVNYTNAAAAAGGNSFLNDGKTMLFFVNGSASPVTMTITKQNKTVNQAGYNPITLADTVITIPGSGTNGGVCMAGPFAQNEYNDATGQVQVAYSAVTTLTVAALCMPRV